MKQLTNSYKYVYIYMIKNLVNGHRYVGIHVTNLEFDKDNYYGSGKLLNEKIIEYGENNFIMGIIEYINVYEWRAKEIFWIKEMQSHVSLQNGYNLTWGGDGCLGLKQTSEHTEKIRQKNLGLKRSKETIELFKTQRQYISTETRKRQSESHIGKKQSEETVKNRTFQITGLKRTPEFCKNISEKRKGMTFSDSHKENLSKSLVGRHLSEDTKNKLSAFNKDVTKEIICCPHCNTSGGKPSMLRWHFDNCKILK